MALLSCKHAGWRLVVDGLWGGSVAGGAVSRPEDVTEKKKDKEKSMRQGSGVQTSSDLMPPNTFSSQITYELLANYGNHN